MSEFMEVGTGSKIKVAQNKEYPQAMDMLIEALDTTRDLLKKLEIAYAAVMAQPPAEKTDNRPKERRSFQTQVGVAVSSRAYDVEDINQILDELIKRAEV